jgi:hypothetical protein
MAYEPLLSDVEAAAFLGGLHPKTYSGWLGADSSRLTVSGAIGASAQVSWMSGSVYNRGASQTRLLSERN